MIDTNAKTTLDLLYKQPIFRMSLGSKELFHSNMLQWQREVYPVEMSRVFSQLLETEIEVDPYPPGQDVLARADTFLLPLTVCLPWVAPVSAQTVNQDSTLPITYRVSDDS